MKSIAKIRRLIICSIVALLTFLIVGSTAFAAPSKVVHRINTSEKVVVLTIDDGYDSNNYSRMLQMLDKHGIKATFFINGQAAQNNAQLVRNTAAKGHEFGITHTAIQT